MTTRTRWLIAMGCAAVTGTILVVHMPGWWRAAYLCPVAGHVDVYVSRALAARIAPRTPQRSRPHLKGKVIVVNDCGEVDAVYWELPRRLRARRPDQVGTIVLVEWNGDHSAKVWAVDGKMRRVIAKTYFPECVIGGPPVAARSYPYAPVKPGDVARFLTALPRR